MKPQVFGLAPMRTQDAVDYRIPSLGTDNSGRVMVFTNIQEQAVIQGYYVAHCQQSARLFPRVFAQALVLVQINGDLPEAKAEQYQTVRQSVSRVSAASGSRPIPTAQDVAIWTFGWPQFSYML